MDRSRVISLLSVLVATLAMPGLIAAAPAPQVVTEGVIASADAASFTVTAANGSQVRITANVDTRIIRRQQVRLEEIKPNDLVGVTAKREPDGSLIAISINIVPPEFKDRFRETQFVMDTGNIMTNARVFQNVRRIDGRTLYLKLSDGSTIITVPKEAAVFRLAVINVSDLRPGMRVVVRGTGNPDGSVLAASVTVDVPR
jgi:RNase P/RNase MRP subunit p29